MSADSDLEALRASFRDVLDDAVAAGEIRAHVDRDDTRCEPLWAKAVDLGWFALLTPERFGGLEMSREAAAVLYEELGRVAAPLPMLGALLGADIIAKFGEEAQQQVWLPRFAAGEIATFIARDVAELAEHSAEARDLLDGAEASLMIASAADGRWFLAPLDRESVESEELVDRTRGLARARFAETSALRGNSAAIGSALQQHVCIALACDSIGGARAVLDLTVSYLKTREQFGKPIGTFQALKHRCAEHKVAIEAADALVTEAVARWDSEDDHAELYALLAKVNACEAYVAMATDAVQLHGGIGFTWEHVCHLYLKRAKLNQVLFGSTAAQLDAAAKLLVT